MKQFSTSRWCWLVLTLLFLHTGTKTFATHAQSADITYTCLGGNTYEIMVSFYRDCAGVAAPGSVTVNASSASCGQNLNVTLNQVPGTGQDITPICNSMTTECSGGSYPGVQEWQYIGTITLPMQCTDWVFSFSLCCRNNAITTIVTPGAENIYVEANLDNLNFPCNSSPAFTNPPVPFVCVGQLYCFNHGANDPDGDSLVYSLIPPATSPTTSVTYLAGYSAISPVSSLTGVTIDPITGDICMTPSILEVTVMAVLVEEYRGGVLVGSVVRDIQLRTVVCTNTLPTLNGINNTGNYSTTACAGTNLTFTIPSFDPDAGQTVSLTWNNGIPAASFTVDAANPPTGTFSWTPTAADISSAPHCFTVAVSDDNCPFNGTQTYAFCITVGGAVINAGPDQTVCNQSPTVNLGATVTPAYSVSWTNGTGTYTPSAFVLNPTYTPSAAEIMAGQAILIVNANPGGGCVATDTVIINLVGFSGALTVTGNNVSCYGAGNGSASASVIGGSGSISYIWNTTPPDSSPTISMLDPGNYTVTVTDGMGCSEQQTVIISEPDQLVVSTGSTGASCNGSADGTAIVAANGGTPSYTYQWNTVPPQTTATALGLAAGTYSVTVTDSNGCTASASALIAEPTPITISVLSSFMPSCFGLSNGMAEVVASGGTAPFNYSWNTVPPTIGATLTGAGAGTYVVTVTDNKGCTDSLAVTLTEPGAINSGIAQAMNVSCNGGSDGELLASVTGGVSPYTITWSTVPVQVGPSATGLNAGSYTATITDANGCTALVTGTVTQPAPVSVTAWGADTICPGTSTILGANASGGNGGYSYWWNGVPATGSFTASPGGNTWYNVTAFDSLGCPGNTDSVLVVVNDINNATLTVLGGAPICEGDNTNVWATLTGGMGTYALNWSCGCIGYGPHVLSPPSSTYVTVTVTDECANTITDSVYVEVHPLPVINLTPQSGTGCGNVSLTFNNGASSPAGSFYSWDMGNGILSNDEAPTTQYTISGTYPVILELTSPFGCTNTGNTTATVNVLPQASADFMADDFELSIYDPTVRFTNTSTDAGIYGWSFGDGNFSIDTDPVHTYEFTGRYAVKLIANNSYACPDTVVKFIEVMPEFSLYVPNTFTPDGDGLNEIFLAQGEEISEFEMYIYNRWGESIFSTSSMQYGWDGTVNGQEVESEVYVYQIKAKDTLGDWHDLTGHVTLLR